MATFPEAVKSVTCAHDEGVFSGTTCLVELSCHCVTCMAQTYGVCVHVSM